MTKTVLIVDDINFIRKELRDILTQAHFQIVGEAADGNEAIEFYNKLRPDIVTMDIVMPYANGIDTTRKLIKLDKNARVVVVSAMGQEHVVMDAIAAGVRDYIMKPFSAQDIVKTLEKIFQIEKDIPGYFSKF